MVLTPQRKRVVLTARDKELFNYLISNKVATVKQIQRDVFLNCSVQGVHKRLAKLQSYKFISANYVKELNGALVYSVSKEGYRKVFGGEGMFPSPPLRSGSILHDLWLLEIRQRLSGFKMVEKVFSENDLQLEGNSHDETLVAIREVQADGAVVLHVDNRKVFFALEYEASLKFFRRYKDFFLRYNLEDQIAAVLFVAADKTLQKKIMVREQTLNSNSSGKIFYLSWEDVQPDSRVWTFQNVFGDTLKVS